MNLQPSPLLEASPDSLQEIFDRDPLSLTLADAEQICKELRAQRERWEKAQKASRSKAQVIAAADLKDLGL